MMTDQDGWRGLRWRLKVLIDQAIAVPTDRETLTVPSNNSAARPTPKLSGSVTSAFAAHHGLENSMQFPKA